MHSAQDWSVFRVVSTIGSVGILSSIPGALLLSAHAQSAYPDIPSDYWAQPYIQQLSERDILTGYPDGTFRPEQPIDRDEYAAVIRQAFDAESVRSIPEASSFEDVPESYWANAAIEEAYEMGFMGTPKNNEFEPQTPITRADAIVALVEGLGADRLMVNAPTNASTPVVNTPAAAAPVQPVRAIRRMKPTRRLAFPIASTTIMALFAPPPAAASATQPAPPSAQATGTNPDAGANVPLDLSEYYADADQIPDYARDEVAIATQAGLIVNYPDPNFLNPNDPVSRAGTAALIYQVLERQGELTALPEDSPASKYVVKPSANPSPEE